MNDLTEEEKKKVFEMKGEIKMFQLYQISEIINLASTRGAFKASELSFVGSIFDNIKNGLDKACTLVKGSKKLETILETTSETTSETLETTSEI